MRAVAVLEMAPCSKREDRCGLAKRFVLFLFLWLHRRLLQRHPDDFTSMNKLPADQLDRSSCSEHRTLASELLQKQKQRQRQKQSAGRDANQGECEGEGEGEEDVTALALAGASRHFNLSYLQKIHLKIVLSSSKTNS